MLSLTHSSPDEFIWKNKSYKVDLAFDTVLLYLQLQQDEKLSPFEKWLQSCKLFFGSQELPSDPKFYESAFRQIQAIITDNPYGTKEIEKDGGVEATKQFDYVRDAGAIYASFFEQYHIDLNKERGKMHWDTFKALFDGLGPKTYFQRILQIRREDLTKIDDPKARQELYDSQNYYAVDGAKTGKERTAQALNNSALGSAFKSLFEDAEKGGN